MLTKKSFSAMHPDYSTKKWEHIPHEQEIIEKPQRPQMESLRATDPNKLQKPKKSKFQKY